MVKGSINGAMLSSHMITADKLSGETITSVTHTLQEELDESNLRFNILMDLLEKKGLLTKQEFNDIWDAHKLAKKMKEY